MSRTIAHRPWDLVRLTHSELTMINHDHRTGQCKIETLQDWRERYSAGSHCFGMTSIAWRFISTCSPQFTGKEAWRFLARATPPRKFRRDVYTRPARHRARNQLRMARREWNTFGMTDSEVEPYRTRSQAKYHWD